MPIYDAGARIAQVAGSAANRIVENKQNRQAAQTQAAELKLRENTANMMNDPEYLKTQVEAIHAQNQQLAAKQAKEATYSAFRMFTSDWNPRHLNNLIQAEPLVKQAFGDVVRYERINPEVDKQLMTQAGLTLEGEGPNVYDPRIHLKAILPDGSATIEDLRTDMAGTGYLNYIQDEELDRLIKISNLFGKGKDKEYAPGDIEKSSKYLSGLGIGTEEDIARSLYRDKTMGNVAGQLEEYETTRDTIFKSFGGEQGYYNADVSELSTQNWLYPYIHRLQRMGDVDFSNADWADIKEINALIPASQQAITQLTEKETGAYDNLMHTVSKYISDNVENADKAMATSAYAAFRNTLRHALFGSALTETEVQSFNEAFGTLKQKYPVVMQQFKTAMQQIKAKMQTMMSKVDPIVAHYYLGKNYSKIDRAIKAIDQRLELFSVTGTVPRGDINPASNDQGAQPQTLESILGGVPPAPGN